MVEVTSSSTNGAVLSGTKKQTQAAFDVRSWQGLTQVLQVARNANLSKEEYSEFRDLVLAYAQSGGDEKLRQKIDTVIASFKNPAVASPEKEIRKTDPKWPLATITRKPPTPGAPAVPEDLPIGFPEIDESVEVPPTSFQQQEKAHEGEQAEKKVDEPVFIPKSVREPAREPEPATIAGVTPLKAESILPPEPPPAPAPMPQQGLPITPPPPVFQVGSKTIEDYRRRIAEIKHEVNSRVGNPVALVEAGNEMGKEYMNALLAAMKASAAGYPGGLATAMARLEKAFELLLTEPQKVAAAPKIEDVKLEPILAPQSIESLKPILPPKQAGPEIQEVVKSGDSMPAAPVAEEVKTPSPIHELTANLRGDLAPIDKEQRSEPITPLRASTLLKPPKPVEGEILEMQHAAPSDDLSEKAHTIAQRYKTRLERTATMPPPERVSTVEHVPEKTTMPLASVRHEEHPVSRIQDVPEKKEMGTKGAEALSRRAGMLRDLGSIPQEKTDEARGTGSAPLEAQTVEITGVKKRGVFASLKDRASRPVVPQPSKLWASIPGPKEEEVGLIGRDTADFSASSFNQSEISSPEVIVALNQLLNEWSLFKNSGFLGIGPSGMEHPLYKKLSQLSMFAVVSGRWDRSDPKVTKIIKDYVNAWRHEQGVMYVQSETFEHYLRRVVLRIIKRQKR